MQISDMWMYYQAINASNDSIDSIVNMHRHVVHTVYQSFIHLSSSVRRLMTMIFHLLLSSAALFTFSYVSHHFNL